MQTNRKNFENTIEKETTKNNYSNPMQIKDCKLRKETGQFCDKLQRDNNCRRNSNNNEWCLMHE